MPGKMRLAAAQFAFTLLLFGTSITLAQSTSTFDLPPQPLADSLRAVASSTHTNILFDADVVVGITAPALKGSATAEQAVARLLAGTGLRYFKVAGDTIRVAREPESHRPPRAPAD